MDGYATEDYLDSGMKPGERGAPITIGEATRAVKAFVHYEGLIGQAFVHYEGLIGQFLLRRVKRLSRENEALRKLQTDEAIKNRRLEKELRDIKATLSESAANGGTWPV